MTKIKCSYLGDLNCDAVHLQSGIRIKKDAPLDHCGKGESFSPTDLLATSLGTCILKIEELIIDIFIPETTSNLTIDFLKKASKDCPVRRNLSDEIKIKIIWHYNKSQKL